MLRHSFPPLADPGSVERDRIGRIEISARLAFCGPFARTESTALAESSRFQNLDQPGQGRVHGRRRAWIVFPQV